MRRQQQQSAGPEDAQQLVTPGELQLGGEVREDRERVDEVERSGVEVERRRKRVAREACEPEVVPAPVDRLWIDVAACHHARKLVPVPRHASTAAAEVEHRLDGIERNVRHDRVVRGAPAAQEPVRISRPRDAHHQPPWGEGRPVDRGRPARSQRNEALVAAERGRDETGPAEQAEDSALHDERTL